MGQFSWYTQDTKEPIYNDWKDYGDQQIIHMVDPRDGKDYIEKEYEGYGVFGGRDFYELFADINKDIIIDCMMSDDKENIIQLLNKKFEDLTQDDIDEKRQIGIDIWFDESFNKNRLKSPILVEDYTKWKWYIGIFPKADPYQGWHMQEDSEEDNYDE